MKPDGVLESCLYASDLAAEEAFFTRVLQLDVIGREPGRHVFFRCGHAMVLVFNPAGTEVNGLPIAGTTIPLHGARGPGHLAFRMHADDVARWREQLRAAGVAIETEIAWPQGGCSLYFRDPAGNSLELATPVMWGIQ